MQKLFRRSHCCSIGVGVVVSASPPMSTSSLNSSNSFSLLHHKQNRKAILQMPSTAAAFRLVPAVGIPNFRRPAAVYRTSRCSFSASVKPITKCSDEKSRNLCSSGGVPDARAWSMLKESRPNCSKNAWLGPVTQALNAEEEVSSKVETETGETEKGSEEKSQVRVQRRQRGGGGGGSDDGGNVVPGNMDLLIVPGIGPRNLKKLVEKGIAGVADLKQLYKDKFFGKSSQNMVEYLKSSVGIIHRNHAESITTYIKESVDEELKEQQPDVKILPKKRLTFCVEGNISVGKTTFLQRIANETLELQDLVEIVPEPIDKWQDVGPDHFNILNAFYAEPQRYAYTFQNYVFVTRVMQERESSSGIRPLRLMERSVFSDRMVFVRAVHEAKWMNEMEISIYDSWFDPVVTTLPGLIPDGFIYLRATPDTCHKRMLLRKRDEEGGVSLDYLRDLHEKHESWLLPFESGNHGVLSVSKLPHTTDCPLDPDIKDRVFYLEGNHMHSSIQKVPALVLDCEPNIDFSKDIEAKRHYARQVAEFFAYVKKRNEILTPKVGTEESGKQNQGHVILPHKGLWVPGGATPFPESALKSLDFGGAKMSSFHA